MAFVGTPLARKSSILDYARCPTGNLDREDPA